MSDRITEARLYAVLETWERVCPAPEGHTWSIDMTYGGNRLDLLRKGGGAVMNSLWDGYCSKREAWERIHAAIRGVRFAREWDAGQNCKATP